MAGAAAEAPRIPTAAEPEVIASAAGSAGSATQEVHPSLNKPVSCVYVSFKGLKRISPHSLICECGALGNAQTLGGVQDALNEVQQRLAELNIIKTLQYEVFSQPNGVVDVAFIIEERGRECTVSGNVDKKGEVSCDLRLGRPALFGGPLSATASLGSTASQAHEFLVSLTTPRFLGKNCSWNFDVARSASDEREASSYSERITHAVMKLSDSSGVHSVFLEAAVRDLYPATEGSRLPSVEVQGAQLRSVKTSLRYTCTWVSPALMAASGLGLTARLRGDVEIAGLLGNTHFVRHEASASASLRLPRKLLWHFAGSCGMIMPTSEQPTCLQDRFFLGGASGFSSMFKGFANRGVGPVGLCQSRDLCKPTKRLADALGGDAMWNTFTAISMPVSIPSGQSGGSIDGQAFAFLGLGALVQPQYSGMRTLLEGLRAGSRTSVGVGLGIPLAGMGTLELTFACPLRTRPHDLQQRLQLGLRLDVRG